jgi:UDPglucose--hexose-1-phosphate uridylyltransferase
MFSLKDHPHRRYNPLIGEWVLVSPQRMKRPWQGRAEKDRSEKLPQYDQNCYLCPGNERISGVKNPNYTGSFVFTNDFSALLPNTQITFSGSHTLLRAESVRGTCRVICFSPRHDLTLPEMNYKEIRGVVETWIEQTIDLGRRFRWVQIFENKGEIMGCSNPHPHGQIWASNKIPNEAIKEDRQQLAYFQRHEIPLLVEYCDLETLQQERIVIQDKHWLAIVPFWAIWPFETILLPRRHVMRLPDLSGRECDALAQILKRLLTKYDNLFSVSFPYSMGWHGAPTDSVIKSKTSIGSTREALHWQLHAHLFPPLLRSPIVRKFMVGYEMLAEAQRDLTAEQAAARLRASPEVHYKDSSSDI